MISPVDRYHGAVLRHLLVQCRRPLSIGLVDVAGRADTFSVDGFVFQIRHSRKRLPPWRFTCSTESLNELDWILGDKEKTWMFFVCGVDGIVGIALDEVFSLVAPSGGKNTWFRITRDRRSMYRITGPRAELPRAKPRGVEAFIAKIGGSSWETFDE